MESTKPPSPCRSRVVRQALLPTLSASALGLCLAILPPLAQAQIFVCKDAAGHTLTSDRPIPECADRAMRELNQNGVQKREIAAPLTPEQRRQKQAAEEKRKADEADAAEQKRRDTLILSTYRNEEQIDSERQRAVAQLRNNINICIEAVDVAERKKRAGQTEADALKAMGKPVTSAILMKMKDADQISNYEKKNIDALESEMVKLKAKYDDTMKRYRQASGTASAK
jgi:hypothetical protein